MNFTIQPFQDADLLGILDIYNDAILHTTAVYDYDIYTAAQMQTWIDTKQHAGYPVLVARVGDDVAGFAALGAFRPKIGYQYTAENSIYIHQDFRGLGLGKRLLYELIQAARAMQLHAIVAGIDAENEPSIQLHKAFGFVEVAHFPQVGYKFAKWLDVKFLQLILVN